MKSARQTFEIDIKEAFDKLEESNNKRFEKLNESINNLTVEFHDWKNIVNNQLEKLNDNMTKVLNQISDHENRISKLELSKHDENIKHELLVLAGKIAISVLGILASAGGVSGILKLFRII